MHSDELLGKLNVGGNDASKPADDTIAHNDERGLDDVHASGRACWRTLVKLGFVNGVDGGVRGTGRPNHRDK